MRHLELRLGAAVVAGVDPNRAALRDGTLALLESLPPDARARPAEHAAFGPTTLRGQVEALLAHDAEHLAEIAAMLGQGGAG